MGRIMVPGGNRYRGEIPPQYAMEVAHNPKDNKAWMRIHAFRFGTKQRIGLIEFSFDLLELDALIGKLEAVRKLMLPEEKKEDPAPLIQEEPPEDNP